MTTEREALTRIRDEAMERYGVINADWIVRTANEALAPPADAAPAKEVGHVIGQKGGLSRAAVLDHPMPQGTKLYATPEPAKAAVTDARDAARYRWLKTASKAEYLIARGVFGLDDAAIDAALSATPPEATT